MRMKMRNPKKEVQPLHPWKRWPLLVEFSRRGVYVFFDLSCRLCGASLNLKGWRNVWTFIIQTTVNVWLSKPLKSICPVPWKSVAKNVNGNWWGSAQIKATVYEFQNERERNLVEKVNRKEADLFYARAHHAKFVNAFAQFRSSKKGDVGKGFIRNVKCDAALV